jgi:hypothetical protein
MTYCEVIHFKLNKIFVCEGFELKPGTDEYEAFQLSTEKEILKNPKIKFVRDYIEPNNEADENN